MRLIFTLIAVYFIYTPLFSQCVDSTNIYTFTHNGTIYEIVKEAKTWVDAAACAAERNGYLVEINDLNEQNAVYNAIIIGAEISPSYTSIANGGGIAYVWIGANDQQTEGTWLWDGNNDNTGINFWVGEGDNGSNNGSTIDGAYYNWGGTSTGSPNEPDNYGTGQDCAAIALAGWPSGTTMLGIPGEWNDIVGTSQLYFVIEKNSSNSFNDHDNDLNEDLKIYPNLIEGTLIVDMNYELIEIYDINGKLLNTYTTSKVIDISELLKTIYFIRITGDSFVKTKKIILN
ncbi:MAG: hypothetical protein A2X64_01130 [Ignavibacteria bacterium GWF2_33_9]|nr:MAG: hypothetical protein A2X64_01130 [Ignavibacteria bacterium GWF2_33_9]